MTLRYYMISLNILLYKIAVKNMDKLTLLNWFSTTSKLINFYHEYFDDNVNERIIRFFYFQ